MKKIFARLIWVPLGLAFVWFLVSNRQMVAISLDPFSVDAPSVATPALPMWVWLMGSLLTGFFSGAGAQWVSASRARRQARADRRELRRVVQEQESAPAKPPAETLPVLKAS